MHFQGLKRFFFALCLICAASIHAQIEQSHLYNPVGNSNSFGHAVLQRDIGSIDASSKSRIPVVLEFNSDPQFHPSGFGAYWNISFFNTKLLNTSDVSLEWVAPNGWSYYFSKKSENKNARRGVFEERSGGWTCTAHGNGSAKIENSKDPGIFFEYRSGKLYRFKLGKDGDIFDIRYAGKNSVKSLFNSSKNTAVLSFEFAGEQVSSLKFKDAVYKFEYGEGTSTAPDGVKMFKDYGIPLLSKIEYPDGSVETFAYASNEKRKRNILKKDFTTTQTQASQINKMTVYKNELEDGFIEWDATTGYIIADANGEYKVGNSSDKYNSDGRNYKKPDSKIVNERPRLISIEHKNKDKPHSKIWQYDWENLVEIWKNEDSGDIHRYSMMGAQGPSFLKLRKVEKYAGKDIKSDKNSWQMDTVWNYDDAGRLLRIIYGNGDIYRIEYDKAGKELRRLMNDILVKENKYDEKGNLASVWQVFKGKEYLSEFKGGLPLKEYENGKLVRKISYDKLGRILTEKQPGIVNREYKYNNDETYYCISDWDSGVREVSKILKTADGFTSLESADSNGNKTVFEKPKGFADNAPDPKITELLQKISNNKKE